VALKRADCLQISFRGCIAAEPGEDAALAFHSVDDNGWNDAL